MVDLPPGGVKRMKNSRKNHMVFWVFRGRVRVEVAGTAFSIGRGGMWQVPRGKPPTLSFIVRATTVGIQIIDPRMTERGPIRLGFSLALL